ncbi:hypothetical protein HYW21_00865 [Candidatus Woesearchaeota archaeon]|nr:hypothetical protein [Candidatus Woesearchaeota archaeon]
MAERRIVVDRMKLGYKGLFDARELYAYIDRWYRQMGYTKQELRNYEHVYPEGKQIEVVYEPYRKITDFHKFVIRVELIMNNVKEVIVQREQHKAKLNQGHVEIIITGYMETDYEHRWEGKPYYYFIRALYDQFIYKVKFDRFEGGLVEEINELYGQLKAFLNLYRFEGDRPIHNTAGTVSKHAA